MAGNDSDMTLTREQFEQIGQEYISGRATLRELSDRDQLNYDTLIAMSETGEWGRLREECKRARLRAPIEAVLRLNGNGNGHQQVQIDLAAPILAYHAAADKLRVMIERAQADWEEAGNADERGKVEARLDRLLERQRIMLRIPGPGRDSGREKRIQAPAEAREV